MLIALLSEAPPHRRVITKSLLDVDQLISQYGSPHPDFKNGLAFLWNETEELPIYLRPGVRRRLNRLRKIAYDWNAAVIIPDIVQKSLFQSENVYQTIAKVYVRPRDEAGIREPVEVKPATLDLGFWDDEKLLLLEMLLWDKQQNLRKVSPALRRGKVFWIAIEKRQATPSEEYRVIKFDSPSVIKQEYKNYLAVKTRIGKSYGITSSELDHWSKRTYSLDNPKGQKYDLLNVLASTVEAVGLEEAWPSQTLEAQWGAIEQGNIKINDILADTFTTLRILYKVGLQRQTQPNPRQFSIKDIYQAFYKRHITPADCVVKCTLDMISLMEAEEAGYPSQATPYPPNPEDQFNDAGFCIDKIKLWTKEPNSTDPEISLIIKKTEHGVRKLVEVRLDPLANFKLRREFYDKGIREKARFISVRGICESNYKSSLSNSILHLPPIAGEKVLMVEPDNIWNEDQITFASGEKHSNPLYFYGQIYDKDAIDSIRLKSLFTWIHGDLNVGNIIVRQNGDTRIIDLARLKKCGPLEFDFAELEMDLKIKVLYKKCKLVLKKEKDLGALINQIFIFEKELLRCFDNDFKPNEVNSTGLVLEEFQTGFLTIIGIRKKLIEVYGELIGEEVSPADVFTAYMAAIFFESVAVLNFSLDPLAKMWALIASTVACEKLFRSNARATTVFST